MSITEINEVWRGETLSDTVDGTRSYTRKFDIFSDDPGETWTAVRAVLPTGAHPDDASAYVTSRSVARSDESRLKWEADINYEFKPRDIGDDPTQRPPKIRWTGSLIFKAVFRDRDGDACVNSAGDYFDPPLEAEFPRATATIQFNAADVPAVLLSYNGSINIAPVTIDGIPVSAERCRLIGVDIGEQDEENGFPFRSITLVVECRDAADEGFDLYPLDQGFRVKDTGDPYHITRVGTAVDAVLDDEDGGRARASVPILLDGAGGKLIDPSPTTAVFLTYEMPRRVDLTIFPGIS